VPAVTHPFTLSEIIAALEANARSIAEFFSAQPDAMLLTGDPDHWGPAHHLIHLTQTSATIECNLRTRPLAFHSSGRSRDYAGVRDAATSSLMATPKERLLEMGRVAVIEPGATGASLVQEFVAASRELRSAAATWDEEDLDRRALRHPLIGELTVREMLFFC